MLFRYQVLEKLIILCPKNLYGRFDCAKVAADFPAYPLDLVISAIYDLEREGLVSFTYQSESSFFSFSVSRVSRSHLYSLDEVAHIKTKEKWLNRLYGFISAIVLKYILSALLPLLEQLGQK